MVSYRHFRPISDENTLAVSSMEVSMIDKLKAALGHKFKLIKEMDKVRDSIAFTRVDIRDSPAKGSVSNSDYNLAEPKRVIALNQLSNLEWLLDNFNNQYTTTNNVLRDIRAEWVSKDPDLSGEEHFKSVYTSQWTALENKYTIAQELSSTGVHDVSPPQLDASGTEYDRFGFELRDVNGSLEAYSEWEQVNYKPHGGKAKHMEISKHDSEKIFGRNAIIMIGLDSGGYKLEPHQLYMFNKEAYDKDFNLKLIKDKLKGIHYENIEDVAKVVDTALQEKFPHGVYNIGAMEIANLVVGTNSENAPLTPTRAMIDLICRLTDRLRSLGGTRGYWYTPYKSRSTKHYAIAVSNGDKWVKKDLGNKK